MCIPVSLQGTGERGEVAGHARYLSKSGIVLKTQEMLLNLGVKRDYENYGG